MLKELPSGIRAILALTCAFFVAQIAIHQWLGIPLVEGICAMVLKDTEGLPWWEVWRLVTYGLVHADSSHLFWNMLGLVCIGPALEGFLGTKRFSIFYILCLIGGAITALLMAQLGVTNVDENCVTLIGASAGTIGVLFACIVLDPECTMLVSFLFSIKAKYLGIFIALYELYAMFYTHSNTSNSGHLGGIAVGALLAGSYRINLNKRLKQMTQTLVKKWKRRHIKVIK